MSIWGKRTERESSGRGVARAALDGASREELVREAQKSLAKEGRTGRIGVWLEPDPDASPQKEAPAGFRGVVLDRGSDETPQEWATLSVEPPLPEELLLRGKTVEQDLDAFPANPITGVLVGLRHALWVPIERKEQLRGVILVGSLEDQPSIFRQSVESVAAELSLALGLQEEQRIARHGNTDLGMVKRFLRTPAGEHSPDTVLRNLVESCTSTAGGGESPGATFAAIGALRHPREPSGENFSLEFLWHSGDAFWTRAIQSEPLAGLWRRALLERRVIGSASEMGWTRGTVDRIVAFPLEAEGQLAGALVAGLPLMRLSGLAAGIATFGVLQITHNLLRYYEKIGPGLNTFSSVPETTGLLQAAVGALIAIGVAFAYQRSRFGRMLRATREDPPAASATGISIYRQRLGAFVVSGLLAGFAGGLYVHLLPLNTETVYLDLTFITLAMLVVGGATSLWGAVVGALAVSALDSFLAQAENGVDVFGGTLDLPAGTRLVVVGTLMALVLIVRPSGITGGRELQWRR